MTNEKVVRIEDDLYGGYSTVQNPVSDYWEIELYLYPEKNENYIFVVRFTSMLPIELPTGKKIIQSILIKEVEFEDKERAIRKKLRNIGMVNDIIFRGIKDYIQYLKLNKLYKFYDEGSKQLEFSSENSQKIASEGFDYYNILLRNIEENPNLYPTINANFVRGITEGIFINEYKEFGHSAVAISGEQLQETINIVGKTQFEDVIRCWKDLGLLLSGDSNDNRLTSKFTFGRNYRVNAYIIKIDGYITGKNDQSA